MKKLKFKKGIEIDFYCFDLAQEIIGSILRGGDLEDVSKVSDILYREFENKTKGLTIEQKIKLLNKTK
tara:strand:- start:1038 stop:1241 length:204 start_codon:yes stop_codon:yes gene_type:complete